LNHEAHEEHEGLSTDVERLSLQVVDAGLKVHKTPTRVHEAQVLTYLKLSRMRLGFLMNFNVALFKQGLRRLMH
jgi:GxxExxY protein